MLPNIIRFPDSSFNNKNKGPTPGIFRVTNGLTNGGHGKSRYRDATRSSVRQNSYKSLKKKYPTLTRLLQSTHDNLYSNYSNNVNGIWCILPSLKDSYIPFLQIYFHILYRKLTHTTHSKMTVSISKCHKKIFKLNFQFAWEYLFASKKLTTTLHTLLIFNIKLINKSQNHISPLSFFGLVMLNMSCLFLLI